MTSASKEGLVGCTVGRGSCLTSTWLVGSQPEPPNGAQAPSKSTSTTASRALTSSLLPTGMAPLQACGGLPIRRQWKYTHEHLEGDCGQGQGPRPQGDAQSVAG